MIVNSDKINHFPFYIFNIFLHNEKNCGLKQSIFFIVIVQHRHIKQKFRIIWNEKFGIGMFL